MPNPAPPLPGKGEERSSRAELQLQGKPRTDPTDTPLISPDFGVFVGGSALRDPGRGRNTVGLFWRCCWGFWVSVVSSDDLITFIDACKHAPHNTVSVYTDSRYILGLFMTVVYNRCHYWSAIINKTDKSLTRVLLYLNSSKNLLKHRKWIFLYLSDCQV